VRQSGPSPAAGYGAWADLIKVAAGNGWPIRRHASAPRSPKSILKLRLPHRAQMGVYFLLDEQRFGVRPPYGNVVLRDGTRFRVENDEKLQAWVLDLDEQIRAARSRVAETILVSPKPGQCRPCGQKGIVPSVTDPLRGLHSTWHNRSIERRYGTALALEVKKTDCVASAELGTRAQIQTINETEPCLNRICR
jgi:hypothetical protein